MGNLVHHLRIQHCCCSGAESCPTLWSNELQYIRLPCPSPSAGVCSNSCPLNQGCYLTSRPLPPSSPSAFNLSQHHGLFPMSRLFTSGGQSIGASASATVLPMNIQSWFPLGLIVFISLQSKGLSGVFSRTTITKHQFFSIQLFFSVQLSHPYTSTGKTRALTIMTFVGKVMSLLFNTVSLLVRAVLPRGRRLHFIAAATVCSDCGAPENSLSLFPCVSASVCHEVMGPDAVILRSECWVLS